MSIRIFENILAYRRTRDGYAFTVIKIEISQNCPRMLMQSKSQEKNLVQESGKLPQTSELHDV